ncbi:DUF3857 domain-containing protein [Marivirga harenae]|uniref:DUF3857 domain-containing protein n=1 Tax=Marivirga harenae TaxID=2010992 RepID=UPI0026E04EF8|nr:DUF3857 domain-containing protein [Marivirga harenae]WKV13781.1 DUF3857 domain-containing protein [Marivirga harenae]|tara:strand:- start:81211 stop:83112 length:1902 start_codon:yes stop_codon:yes gene_type:complete
MQKIILTIFLSILLCLQIFAQEKDQSSDSAFGLGAEAIILLDSGQSVYNEDFELIFTHTTKIEILKESGLSWANVMIPYSESDSLLSIKGQTYNLGANDSLVIDSLNSATIKKKVNNGIVENYFSLPNAKVGSIIEYSYQIKIADWQELNTWYFQNDIPVLKSIYTTETPNYLLFYKYLEGLLNLNDFSRKTVKKMINDKQTDILIENYQMDSIPAYVQENDVPGYDYFVSKLKFELAEYTLPRQNTEFLLPQNYEELAFNWAGAPFFKDVYSKSSYLQREIDRIYHPQLLKMDVIKGFYFFIRNNFNIDLTYGDKSLEEAYRARKGTPQQINMILTKMLNQSGFDAYLVALSTISNRPTYPDNPNFELFDTYISMVRYNGDNYFMDASEKDLLFNMLPPDYVNNGGLVISQDAPGFVPLSFDHEDKEMITAEFVISDSATINGEYEVKREGYAVYNFDSRFLNNNRTYNDYLIETIFQNMDWNIKKHEVNDQFEESKIIKEYLSFARPADSIAKNYMEIQPIVFNEFPENPLQAEKRQNPLTLYTPLVRKASYSYSIPEGWTVLEFPSEKNVALPDGKGKLMYQCKKMGDTLKIEYSINYDKVIYMPDEYVVIKTFMQEITDTLAQKIVLIR